MSKMFDTYDMPAAPQLAIDRPDQDKNVWELKNFSGNTIGIEARNNTTFKIFFQLPEHLVADGSWENRIFYFDILNKREQVVYSTCVWAEDKPILTISLSPSVATEFTTDIYFMHLYYLEGTTADKVHDLYSRTDGILSIV